VFDPDTPQGCPALHVKHIALDQEMLQRARGCGSEKITHLIADVAAWARSNAATQRVLDARVGDMLLAAGPEVRKAQSDPRAYYRKQRGRVEGEKVDAVITAP
jgi:hypothetical protein